MIELENGYVVCFFFSSRRRHTRFDCDWSSDVCSSDLAAADEVACGVDPHFESRSLHQALDVRATGDIRITECDSTHPALGVCGEVRELDQMLVHPPLVCDTHGWLACLRGGSRSH